MDHSIKYNLWHYCLVPLLSCCSLRSRRGVLSGQREKIRGARTRVRGKKRKRDRQKLTPKVLVTNGILRTAREKGKTRAMTADAFSSRSMSRKSGFRNPGNFFLWNLESWALESGIQLKGYRTLLKIGIQNPNFTNKDQNPVLESGIQGVESRIQDCPLHGVNLPLACSPPPLTKRKK